MAKIIIKRNKAFCGSACKFDVYLMNTYIGELNTGGRLEINVDVGSHTLFFKSKLKLGKSQDTSFEAVVNKPNEIVEINSKFDMSGKFVVEYADNAPHIPMYNNSTAIETNNESCTPELPNIPANANKNMIYCKSCGFQYNKNIKRCPKCNKKTKPIYRKWWFGLIILIIFATILSSNNDNTTIKTSDNSTDSTQNIELSDEEKAQQEIEKATIMFSQENYRKALEICNNISEIYPDTEVANNIDNYIKEQYAQFPQYTARELMSEYEANVVNADETFTDKVMIVSGIITKIDKTNHGKNLCVLLESGTYLWSVQLNFDTSQTEAVSALNNGSNIKVIGKCTGKSGKQLIILNGENIMINDCLIVQ